MAANKKSFIWYVDTIDVFEKLTDEEAGRLAKHLMRYVNDLHPEAPDRLTELLFEPFKRYLKRDLKKWEGEIEVKSRLGIIGNIKRWNKEVFDLYAAKTITFEKAVEMFNEHKLSLQRQNNRNSDENIATATKTSLNIAVSVSDSVSDSVSVSVSDIKEYKKLLLSEIKISDLEKLNRDYYQIAVSFQNLFRENLRAAGASTKIADSMKGKVIDDVRLMIESDGYTISDLRQVYSFLQKDDFWKSNILSIPKLREQMAKLKLKIANNGKQRDYKEGTTFEELAEVIASKFASDKG